jgi:acyl-CoA thioesterase I
MNKQLIKALLCVFIGVMSGCSNDSKRADAPANESPGRQPGANAQPGDTSAITRKNILFFGNSLTAGYGLELSQAFPALIQKRLDSLGLPYRAINAGLSGETTAGGKGRIDWLLRQKVDVFVLELGGNDGLRGIPTKETRRNLQEIIDRVKNKYPDVKIILAGMQIPPNMGPQYAAEFRDIYRDLAEKNGTALIPFLLEGVGGIPKLNLPDGIHPTVEGHKIVMENVWKALSEVIQEQLEPVADSTQQAVGS